MLAEPQTGPVETRLEQASALCARRGARLTDLRRQVLGLVLEAGRPVGAYDLLDRLRGTRRGAAPPTVYRALEFLMEHGLIHRVERLSAFVGCPVHDHAGHAAQFLICVGCGGGDGVGGFGGSGGFGGGGGGGWVSGGGGDD